MLLINGFIEKLNFFPTWLYVIEVLFPTSDLNLKSPTSILAIAWCKPSLNNQQDWVLGMTMHGFYE